MNSDHISDLEQELEIGELFYRPPIEPIPVKKQVEPMGYNTKVASALTLASPLYGVILGGMELAKTYLCGSSCANARTYILEGTLDLTAGISMVAPVTFAFTLGAGAALDYVLSRFQR